MPETWKSLTFLGLQEAPKTHKPTYGRTVTYDEGKCTRAHSHAFISGLIAVGPQVRSTLVNDKMWVSKRLLGLG